MVTISIFGRWQAGGARLSHDARLARIAQLLFPSSFSFFPGVAPDLPAGHRPPYRVGSFSQSACRLHTYIGTVVIASALREEGVRCFGMLIAVAIPHIQEDGLEKQEFLEYIGTMS